MVFALFFSALPDFFAGASSGTTPPAYCQRLINLAGFCIHGDHVLAEHHLKFVGGEHHAQNALALLDGFHLDRRLIFDDKAQTGRAVGDVFDVRGSSTQFNEFRCYFTGIHKTTSFHFYRVILTFRQILNRLIKKMFCVQEGLS